MRIGLGSVLVCLLVSWARSENTGGVSFWQNKFTMTCPWVGNWSKGTTKKFLRHNESQFEQEYSDMTKGHYQCVGLEQEQTYHFYVKGKVCDNCYELEPTMVAVVIVADILLTLGVILVVYVRARKKKPAGVTPKKASSSGPSGGPAASSSDYEALNPHSRSDAYSTVHRTG